MDHELADASKRELTDAGETCKEILRIESVLEEIKTAIDFLEQERREQEHDLEMLHDEIEKLLQEALTLRNALYPLKLLRGTLPIPASTLEHRKGRSS
jgi:chromosome segregation ATPase